MSTDFKIKHLEYTITLVAISIASSVFVIFHESLMIKIFFALVMATTFFNHLYVFRKVAMLKTNLFAIVLVIALLVVSDYRYGVETNIPHIECKKCEIAGEVVSVPIVDSEYKRFDIQTADALIRVATNRTVDVKKGDKIKIIANIKNPYKENKDDSFAKYYLTKGISGTTFMPEIKEIATDDSGLRSSSGGLIENIRNHFVRSIGYPEASISLGVLFGGIEKDNYVEDVMRGASLSHITALSGTNVAIMVSSVYLVFRKFGKKIVTAVTIGVFTLFGLLINFEPSIMRAYIMGLVMVYALYLGRMYHARIATMIAVVVFATLFPVDTLYSVSYHLSILATVTLVYLANPKNFKNDGAVVSIAKTSMLISLVLSMYLLLTFGNLNLFGFVANIFVLPIIGLLMTLGVMLLVFLQSDIISHTIGDMIALIVGYIIRVGEFVSGCSFCNIRVDSGLGVQVMSFIFYALLYIYFINRLKMFHIENTQELYIEINNHMIIHKEKIYKI